MRPWLWLAIVACSKSGPAPEAKRVEAGSQAVEPRLEAGSQAVATTGPDPCSPAALALPAARPLAAWRPPAGCAEKPADGTVLVRSDTDAARHFACSGSPLGFDFTAGMLLIASRMLSPATTGFDALDDGTTVTFVSRFRKPCPNDPRPMPVPMTRVFVIDAIGDRDFAEATCTVDTRCP